MLLLSGQKTKPKNGNKKNPCVFRKDLKLFVYSNIYADLYLRQLH